MRSRREMLRALAAGGLAGVAGCAGLDGGAGGEGETPTRSLTPSRSPTPTSAATADEGSTETPTASPTPSPAPDVDFDVTVDDITKCGFTCRTLHYTVANAGSDAATGVTARIRVYTPDRDGRRVYDREQSIGRVGAGTERSVEKNVDPGLGGGSRIQDNDGRVVIRVLLDSGRGVSAAYTFERQLDV